MPGHVRMGEASWSAQTSAASQSGSSPYPNSTPNSARSRTSQRTASAFAESLPQQDLACKLRKQHNSLKNREASAAKDGRTTILRQAPSPTSSQKRIF